MLTQKSRLLRADFSGVERGARLSSPHLSLTYRRTDALEGRFAVVVSKKVAKRSVDRHLLKRRALEVIKLFGGQGLACVIYARQGASALSFQALKTELLELLKRIPLK